MSTTSKNSSSNRRRRIPVRCPPREPRPHVFYPHIVPKVVSNHKQSQNQKQIEQLRMRVAVLKYVIRFREQEERVKNSQSQAHKRSHPSGGATPRNGPHKVQKRGAAHTPSTAGLHTPRHGYTHTPVAAGTPVAAAAGTPRGVNGGVAVAPRIVHKLNFDPEYPPSPIFRKLATVILSLMNDITAFPFNQPVDYVLLRLPRYPDIIKRPMDLGTIKRTIEEGKYGTVEELKRDVDQVWANCLLFNGPLMPITKSAMALKEKWEKAFGAIARENGLRISATPRGVGAGGHPPPRTPHAGAGGTHAAHTNGVASTPVAAGKGAASMHPTPAAGVAPSTLATPLDDDERWLTLGPRDIDSVTGRVIELNKNQVESLSEAMLKLNAADVMTAVKILKLDPNYAPPLNGKLQFTPARYSKETQRKLQNYFTYLSMAGKTRKKAVTPARVTTQRAGGMTPSTSVPRGTGAMMNGSSSAASRGPPPVRIGGATPRGGGLTPGGGGSHTPQTRGGGPSSLLKDNDDDEDSSSDEDSDDETDDSDSDSDDDDAQLRTSRSPAVGGGAANSTKKRVKWNFANKVKKDAEARKRKAEEAARLATSSGGNTPGGAGRRTPGSLTPGAVPRGSSGLPVSSMTPTAAAGGRPGWPTPGAQGFNRMNSPMGPPNTNRALSSPFPHQPGQSPMHPGHQQMRHQGAGGVPPPPTPGTVAAGRGGHVPPPPPSRVAPSRPGINISQQRNMLASMQSQYGL